MPGLPEGGELLDSDLRTPTVVSTIPFRLVRRSFRHVDRVRLAHIDGFDVLERPGPFSNHLADQLSVIRQPPTDSVPSPNVGLVEEVGGYGDVPALGYFGLPLCRHASRYTAEPCAYEPDLPGGSILHRPTAFENH